MVMIVDPPDARYAPLGRPSYEALQEVTVLALPVLAPSTGQEEPQVGGSCATAPACTSNRQPFCHMAICNLGLAARKYGGLEQNAGEHGSMTG